MKKIYLGLALLFGIGANAPTQAETIVTGVGTQLTTIDELAALDNGTPVMLYNNGRSGYAKVNYDASGTAYDLRLATFTANVGGNDAYLWKVSKTDAGTYQLESYVETGSYLSINSSNGTSLIEGADAGDTFTVTAGATSGTFLFASTQGGGNYLNGNATGNSGSLVGWGANGGNSEYKVYVPTLVEKDLRQIRFNVTFYDGDSEQTLDDAGLSSLIPSTAAEGYITARYAVGDSVALPSFTNNTLRSISKDGTPFRTDTTYFFLEDGDLTDGALTLDVAYSSDPQIIFESTQDVSDLNILEGDILFPNDDVTYENAVRYAIGDSIVPPALSHFTALTKIENRFAHKSERIEVSYRPWRYIFLTCQTEEGVIKTEQIYVDIDSTLTAPDLGEGYVFNAAATTEAGGPELPLIVDKDNINLGDYYDVFYDFAGLPFKLSTVDENGVPADDATWYTLSLRTSKVLTGNLSDEADPTSPLLLSTAATLDESAAWCIVQNAAGEYLFFNKSEANAGKVLCDDGVTDNPVLADYTGEETGFELVPIAGGFGFRKAGSENKAWNDVSNNGKLGYWDNANAWSDNGSKVIFEEYDPLRYAFLDGRAYLNTENCVDGYTADQLSEIKRIIDEGDLEMEAEVTALIHDELATISDDERIQYNPDHAYAIVSAAPEYITRDNVKMALYVQGDTLLAWKEFDPKDKTFYFQLKDREVLQNQAGKDSVVYALYNIATGTYVDGNMVFAKTVAMTKNYDITYDRFHIWPVSEELDADGNVKRNDIPAAFYIDRLRYKGDDEKTGNLIQVTMSMHAGTIGTTTEGTATSYNMRQSGYSTVFRLLDCGDASTVGINSVTTDVAPTADDTLYDLSGRRVQKAEKGIYIQGGKKVYVK